MYHLYWFITMDKTANDFFRALSSEEKDAVAARCGINRRYLNNLIYSNRSPGVRLAAKLEKATNYRVTRESLRPDIDWKLLSGQI